MDDAVAELRHELAALDVDARVVDELVDHFVSTVEARLAVGDSHGEAIITARARLGDLAAIAREHARVALPFGPRPSRWIAWSVAVAMLAWPVIAVGGFDRVLLLFIGWGAVRTVAIAGLACRIPQATAVVHGIASAELLVLVANGAAQLELNASTPLLVISGGTCVALASRSTPLRWAMFALGCVMALCGLVPMLAFATMSLHVVLPVVWILAAGALAVRVRYAIVPCSVLALLVAINSHASVTYVLALGHRTGFAAWHVADLITSAMLVVATVAAAVIAARCERDPRAIFEALRYRRL